MFKDDFLVSPARLGVLMGYIMIPWYLIYKDERIIKPLWGILTDSRPLFGYRRKSYLVIFGLSGSAGWMSLALYGTSDLNRAVFLLFFI